MNSKPSFDTADPQNAAASVLDEASLQPFPVEMLSPLIRDLATDIAKVYCIPPAMPAMAALTIAGAAAGKQYRLVDAVNGQESYSNLFVIAVARRGTGKGSVAAPLIKPFQKANEELREKFAPKRAANLAEAKVLEEERKGLLRQLHQKPDQREKVIQKLTTIEARLAILLPTGTEPIAPSFLEGNCTSEALAKSLKASVDEAILSHSAEAGDLLRVALGRYNPNQRGDFDLLLSGWSSEAVGYNRINRGRIELKPTISALWYTQPFILDELVKNLEAFERGLTARLLIFDAQIELKHDDGVTRSFDPELIQKWKEFILRLLDRRSPNVSYHVQCSSEAREVFRVFHNESIDLRRGQYADVEGELSRWRENAIRIALILWTADGMEGDLTEEQAKRAVKIAHWCFRSYLSILRRGRINQMQVRVDGLRFLLVNTLNKTMTLRDLASRNGFSKEEVKSLATEFPDKFEIVELPSSPNGGRPSEVVRIPNPKLKLYTGFAGNAG